MIFRANREKMELCLSRAKSIVSSKPQMSVLTNILLETEKDRVVITATDLEVGIRVSFEAAVDEGGSATINGTKLLGAIAQLPHEEVLIEIDQKNEFTIRSTNKKIKAKFVLKGMSKESYPPFPTLGPELPRFTIAQGVLKEMIKKTLFAVSTETSRQYLNGVYFDIEGEFLRLVSTDGRRLALIDRPAAFASGSSLGIIVPQKVLTELAHTLDTEGELEIAFSENQIFFSFGAATYASNLIDGNFPNYDQVIPKKQEKILYIERETFNDTLNRSSLLTDEKQNNQIHFNFSPERAVVSVNNADAGSYDDEIAIEYAGEPIDIAFNIKYLKEYLKETLSDKIRIEMNTPLSPVSLHIDSDEKYLYVVMPMKVSN
jgi:DNA polymerase-3 subunit beta